VWVEVPEGEPVLFEPVTAAPLGHALRLRTVAWRPQFTLTLGALTSRPAMGPAELDLRADGIRPTALPGTIGVRETP
jgi:hypothetical protein